MGPILGYPGDDCIRGGDLTGRRLYPIYLITSHTSQEDQTKIELARFLDFYGELTVLVDDQRKCRLIDYVKQKIDPFFEYSPTINTYREHVLQQALPDTMVGPRLEDFLKRRVHGDAIRQVATLCKKANGKGYAPLLIIDEPQYGASDRFVKVDDGVEQRPCVMLQIFNQIDAAIGDHAGDRVFIGLSATPYELHDIDAVWKVKQYLTSSYSGFNYFGGEVIDADADVSPPRTISFARLGSELYEPFMANISLAAYDADPHVFARFANKIGYSQNQELYRRDVEQTLRSAILKLIADGATASTGICIRLFNNNFRSHGLIQNLNLPKNQIDVVEYFGSDHKGQSVKRAIRARARPDLPYLIAVTNRARMGDAFPAGVEWFLEFSKKASDLNALLQGLLGRACGYGKNSTVVMSSENADLVNDYQRQHGGYIYKPSRHSYITGGYRRGAPTSLIRVRRDMSDPLIAKFFQRVDKEVVEPNLIQNEAKLKARRGGTKPYRTGPLLRIADELGLFDHLEQQGVRERLYPTYPDFRIARANDEVRNSRRPDEALRYSLDEDGNCRFTFREFVPGDNSHGGARSRGYGSRDASDRDQAGDKLEPQINMRKFDPQSGAPIDDKRINGHFVLTAMRQPGNWRAEMVTLPLLSPVRELRAGEKTYPVAHSPYSALMSDEEKAAT
ncbi:MULTISPECIES: hypothetical protein [unclassified Mesorhizobium]|uniref:hypothetical protein n=1 Tax=unclassified Mesorhizobium TaxID=325217 RepID=UPI0011278EC0|nr:MULTISPECIES: hypothetical protein [unclassified Mesorhizobium]TPM07366.1 hypothetical protein FJ939_10080 [Mesorhizobium sp. B2-3-8]TPM16076.1 hypothetical protein FJ940_11895 [Mesorhizobium sp. B2-3-7]